MTAPALNIASSAPTAVPGVGIAANATASGPLAGFEALLDSLFPQANPALAGAVAAPGVMATTDTAIAAEDPAEDENEVVTSETASIGDAAAALAASLMAAQTAATPTPTTTDAPNPSPAGQSKIPAAPPFVADGMNTGVAEVAPEVADATTKAIEAPPQAVPAPATAAPAPQARRSTPAATPAEPAAQPDFSQVASADAAIEAAATVAAPPTPPAAETQAARAETTATPAPVQGVRSGKSERAKATADASAQVSDEAVAADAIDKPAKGKSAQAPAKANTAPVETADASTQDAKSQGDTSDVTLQSEARAASQAATPAADASQVVRGSPETVANLSAQILKKLEGKSTRFDVELDPHGLGKVDVRIEINAHGRVTAGMTFENPQAAADVKARAAELQRALEQAGFDLSGGMSFDVAGDRGQQQQQNQAWQDQGDANRAFRGQAFRAALETADDAAQAANHGALRLRRGVSSGVDLKI